MNQQVEVARDGLPSRGLSISQGVEKGREPQATACPVAGLCCEAAWEAETRELSQILVLEGLDYQAEAVGFGPYGHD